MSDEPPTASELEAEYRENPRNRHRIWEKTIEALAAVEAQRDAALEVLDRATQHNPPIPVTTPDKALDNIVSDELDEHGYKVGWNACLFAYRDWLKGLASVDNDQEENDD